MKQAQALRVMLEGKSVFLTGPPGAGKTYILNEYIRRAVKAGKVVAVTASTGIAATHIGGTTIHSWSGLGIRDVLDGRDRQMLGASSKLSKRYNSADVLVIDEVSMLHGQRLNMVNELCKLLRKNNQPFGGLQVILVGDLFQLPPVSRGTNTFDFVHLSDAWEELNPTICYLNEQHRQQESDGLLAVLEAMRAGEVEQYQQELLQQRIGLRPPEGKHVTRLYAHNIDIDSVNQHNLDKIDDEVHTYEWHTKGPAAKVATLARGILAPEVLDLKIGAEVMFVANNPSVGFFNGTRGSVTGFDDDDQPVVKLAGKNRRITVQPHSWTLEEDGRTRAEVSQLPLRLAWAITIHKSQGMSLDAAEIDLSKSFAPGMGYVALSRIRSLDGLYLAGINAMALRMHPDMYELDMVFRRQSAAVAAITPDSLPEEGPESASKEINKELLVELKQWRLVRAAADKVPAYIIAHDKVLELVAADPPQTDSQLLKLKGFGPRKLEIYGPDVLAIVARHTAPQA